MASSVGRWSKRILLGLMVLVIVLALALWVALRGSLAQLDGEVAVAGLAETVSVVRDAQGIPTIRGQHRDDVAYATGYVHAQERFFQMDLLRRVAAGELAGLFGVEALDIDREHRFHRFRARAEAALAQVPASERRMLERYVAGVNAGLAALATRPFEYGLLRTQPAPWRATDSLLVVWTMYFDLQGFQARREFARGWLKEHTSPEQLAFLLPEASAYDAPLDRQEMPVPRIATPAIAPSWFGLAAKTTAAGIEFHSSVGSNNWALAGSRTKSGAAIVANDMHLGLRLPHIWYRAVLEYPEAAGKMRRIAGVTLPGGPMVVVGSNGQVAWGFTNSYGDYLDLIELVRDPTNPLRFKTSAGWENVVDRREHLPVKNAESIDYRVLESSLGPIRQVAGRYYAVRWVAHAQGAVNMGLARLEGAADIKSALSLAGSIGIPAQNMVVGDAAGHIGWTIIGPLPDRDASWESTFPYPAVAGLGWQTLRTPADYPRIVDPAQGQLWTANSRQLGGEEYDKLGDGGVDIGARAKQIRDGLSALSQSDETAVHAIGLDDRALFMSAWRDRAMNALNRSALAGHPARVEFLRLLQTSWTGRASVDSVGYRLARGYLYGLYAELFGQLDVQLGTLVDKADFDTANPRWPMVVARLLDEKPEGWLQGRDWRMVELAAIDRTIAELTKDGKPLASANWGERNTASITHPFVSLLPALGPWLSAPADKLPGDENMPRVAGPAFGQSERMAVAPGKEGQGIMTMPGGQSGHPLSPYFLAGHEAWVRGEPAPFLPGEPKHKLTFVPK
ncbi:penicillin acylase family protein [Chitinimonas sp. BJB300]|uniref:penicillin acylase family protein n=1 Tax=Chitinimonas sp. BJB300 TaxID=1559339 RepID=UPI000C0E38A9|nr:penicillin acylase family protein [Chitinimonas sp. BJB300]PHV11729.1 penicillin acylase family protein [Chitinimonas sp. BJB300]TSJ90006.1 penicillin acylase family protein [Chitinimonas sp. BJB300]